MKANIDTSHAINLDTIYVSNSDMAANIHGESRVVKNPVSFDKVFITEKCHA